MHSIVTTFRGAVIKVEVANFCAAMDTLIDQDVCIYIGVQAHAYLWVFEVERLISYYKSSSVCLFVCLSVCLFVPYLLRGPLTDLRQTWWVYVGGPRNCP